MSSPLARFGAMALAAVTLLAAGAADAQSTKPAPVAPAPGGAPPPQAPIKLDLVGLQSPWTKVCQKDPNGTKEFCRVIRAFGQAADQPPTLVIAVDQLTGEEKRVIRVQLPEGLMLRPGFRLVLEKGDPVDGKFSICASGSCFADAEVGASTFGAFKKAQSVSIIVRNQAYAEVTFNVPMKEFAAAMDGPAVDPKVIEEQNQALQRQLDERAKKAREELEKQQPAAPAATPAPAAPAK